MDVSSRLRVTDRGYRVDRDVLARDRSWFVDAGEIDAGSSVRPNYGHIAYR